MRIIPGGTGTIRIGVICGGQSAEYEISVNSARSVVAALRDEHELELIHIRRDGTWQRADAAGFLAAPGQTVASVAPPPLLDAAGARTHGTDSGSLALMNRAGTAQLMDVAAGSALPPLDVVIPVLHGPFGEDGTIQGLLELAGVPYVGAGVLGSAVAMDKEVTKRLLRDAGVATPRFTCVRAPLSAAAAAEQIATLGLPLFVKPANLGSSVGVTKVASRGELPAAVATALRHDRKVLIEEFVAGRELEVSVLGNERHEASVVGEIVPAAGHQFYSYDAKYRDIAGAELVIPAELAAAEREEARALACRACAILEVEGMARVDFFLRRPAPATAHAHAQLLLNEVNTIPGFTEISMYAKLWDASGVPFKELLRRLIDLALERHRSRAAHRGSPES